MFNRLITPTLLQVSRQFPVTVLTGPRQSGKTTLLRHLFNGHTYVTLESPDIRQLVQEDPRGFFANSTTNWIIDEAQNNPDLFSYLQEWVDDPKRHNKFILSGSQHFLLSNNVSQTLAGRAGILELLPLSYNEYLSHPLLSPLSVWEFIHRGGYPRPYQESIDVSLWFDSYLRTYLERDVRNLLNIKDIISFQNFIKLCAGRHGQLLNLNALANECGISQPTAKAWLSLLEASYLVFRLPPYYHNYNKRVVKTPKLYFTDSALVCQILGITSPSHLSLHAERGRIFEGFVISEIMKHFFSLGRRPSVFFWRDHSGNEIDLLLETGDTIYTIEIKSSATFQSHFSNYLSVWKKISHAPTQPIIIYSGKDKFIHHDVIVAPWDQIIAVLDAK